MLFYTAYFVGSVFLVYIYISIVLSHVDFIFMSLPSNSCFENLIVHLFGYVMDVRARVKLFDAVCTQRNQKMKCLISDRSNVNYHWPF